MAFINIENNNSLGFFARGAMLVKDARRSFVQHRAYRRTYRELQSLGHRELDDLGLNREMIKSVARQAAYGPQK